MRKKNILYVVHCVDTEGPLNESLKKTFQRLKSIFGISIKPTQKNLIKIQNRKIDFGKNTDTVAKVFSKQLMNYNNSWKKIEQMQRKILSKTFRNKFKDSFGKGWVYNWFIIDHVGFKRNPNKRSLGYHEIWNRYKKFYRFSKDNLFSDGFHFHHHPIPFSKRADHSSTHFFNHTPKIFEILSRKILDLKWFPSVFRPGFHSIRPDSHWFLEQFIPFDISNQRTKKIDNGQKDISSGRFGDWRRAPLTWQCYHPDHDDYQKIGNCRRWTARCLNIGTRTRLLTMDDIDLAFKEVKKNKAAILAFANHDYRDMENDIEDIYLKIKEVSKKYPDVKFKFCEARDALRKSLKLKKISIKFKQKLEKNILHIRSDKKIYGPQPFLSIKTKGKKYFHDNFDIQKPFYEWTYTFDENTLELDSIESIGWATNDNYGSTYISIIDPKNKRFKIYER